MYTTIISVEDAAEHLSDPNYAFVDCRFQLDDPAAGRQSYLDAHLPGALYAHLDEDLSGPITGKGGRHPLPDMDSFVKTLSDWGITSDTQVVAYDTANCVYAGRLWWMLRWLGHERVAVLDGDFSAWQQAELPTSAGSETRRAAQFVAVPRTDMALTIDQVDANLQEKRYQLFDARDEARFRGESAGMDPRAGHIPGAKSAFFRHNLGEDGKFLPADQLRERYAALLDGSEPSETVWYCGSGVSVHHDLLAMEIAGFDRGAKVYIGSWSDWSSDPSRPIETALDDITNSV